MGSFQQGRDGNDKDTYFYKKDESEKEEVPFTLLSRFEGVGKKAMLLVCTSIFVI